MKASAETRRAVLDTLIVGVGGQLERALGTLTALAMRWMLDPALLGVYTGLRIYLDNTNRSSLGVSLGAVQEIPILRAAGQEDEARRLADIAYTTNTCTCLVYAAGLCLWAWLRAPLVAGDPLAREWTWGLVLMAALVPLKRYQDFLIAVLRAHQQFTLTTTLAVIDALVSAVVVVAGLALAGFWGLIASVGVLLGFNIVYLHARHPLRFRWTWDWETVLRMLRVGLPIWVNTGLFTVVLTLDRIVILWSFPPGVAETMAGLYTIAIMGTSWSLDMAGRIVTVMYTYFQTTLGRTRDPSEVARQAVRATEAQAPLLLAGAAIAYVVGPVFLGTLMPKYADGLPALRPLLPGMVLLAFAWPARQMLITIDRSTRLAIVTALGLIITTVVSVAGARSNGLVGVAWGMTVGYTCLYLLTTWMAYYPTLGVSACLDHARRLGLLLVGFGAGTLLAGHFPDLSPNRWVSFAYRCLVLAGWLVPALWFWGRSQGWGGLLKKTAT